mgnify:CR=1 FL=1
MHNFNLHHSTFKQALVYAKALSGMTNEDISEASGINGSQVSRYFQEHDAYAPAPYLLPLFCRVLGNTVLVDWLNAQVAELRPATSIRNVQDLTMAVMRATENTGALNSKTLEAIADGTLTRDEARTLQAQFRKNGNWNHEAADALEALAGGKE